MNISITECLNNSFVMGVSNKRKEQFFKNFKKYNLFPFPKYYDGFTIPNGIYKESGIIKTNHNILCTLSHISLIKIAKLYEFPYICIFEDDAYPRKDIYEKLKFYLCGIPDDCDILKLGYTLIKNSKSYDEKFYINGCTYGTHSYIVFQKYYDRYLENIQKDLVADLNAFNSQNANIYICKDNLFIQYSKDDEINIHGRDAFKNILSISSKQSISEQFGIKEL